MALGPKKGKQGSLLDKWLNRDKVGDSSREIIPRPDGHSPLSPGQRRLYFLQQLNPNSPFYHYADALRITGDLNVEVLFESFDHVGKRHEILRTTFITKGEKVTQHVHSAVRFDIRIHDLRNFPEEEREAKSRSLVVEESRIPFDLKEGPLMRISLLRLDEKEYLLAITMHHLITDEGSVRILWGELAECYSALVEGRKPAENMPEIQYADYAYWKINQETNRSELSYWKNKLKGSPIILNLPTDYPRPAIQSYSGKHLSQSFSPELTRRLKQRCTEAGVTPFTLFLAAYTVLLKNYSGENDILVGTPFTDRNQLALEDLFGFFTDTHVLRTDLSNDITFAEVIDQVWKTTREAFANKNVPFDAIVKSLRPDRYLNHNPLFQVMFIQHEVSEDPHFGNGLEIRRESIDLDVSKFDLTLHISERNQQIDAMFEYSSDLFERKTIERMHGHLQNLLEGIADDPNLRISEYPIVTDDELHEIAIWNGEVRSHADLENVIGLFEKQAEQNPDNLAVSIENERLSYRELNEKSNAIASYLQDSEIDRPGTIALLSEPSINMIPGILGILKAGFAYVPIDAAYPKERIEYLIKSSSSTLVLAGKKSYSELIEPPVHVLCIDDITGGEEFEPKNASYEIDQDDLAYVIHTSGSSGKPKGVPVSHSNLASSTMARIDYYKKSPACFLLLSSFSFDSSVAGIFWTLTSGGSLVLAPRRIEQDLNRLGELLEEYSVTHTLLLPSLYKLLLRNIEPSKMASLETVIVAGETCPPSLCQEHFEVMPKVRFYNEYGPSEATVWATVHKLKQEDAESSIPIGQTISNTRVYILDEHQRQVPVGVWGELCVGGLGVVKGYFNDPDLTVSRFIPNTFLGDGTSLYRTGDRCRYRNDGVIEFFGRTDEQIKLRGFRIEPEEIQESLRQVPGVFDAVVKLEPIGSTAPKAENSDRDRLVKVFSRMSAKDADEILSPIENLSAEETAIMLEEARAVDSGR